MLSYSLHNVDAILQSPQCAPLLSVILPMHLCLISPVYWTSRSLASIFSTFSHTAMTVPCVLLVFYSWSIVVLSPARFTFTWHAVYCPFVDWQWWIKARSAPYTLPLLSATTISYYPDLTVASWCWAKSTTAAVLLLLPDHLTPKTVPDKQRFYCIPA